MTVAKRIDAGDTRLAAVEWKSGTNMRIVDIVAPFGGRRRCGSRLETVRPDRFRSRCGNEFK